MVHSTQKSQTRWLSGWSHLKKCCHLAQLWFPVLRSKRRAPQRSQFRKYLWQYHLHPALLSPRVSLMLISYITFLVNAKNAKKSSCIIFPLPDPDVELLLLGEEPKQVLPSPPEVQEVWEQERQQQMWLLFICTCENVIWKVSTLRVYFPCRPPGGNPGPAFSEEKSEEKPNESTGCKSFHV